MVIANSSHIRFRGDWSGFTFFWKKNNNLGSGNLSAIFAMFPSSLPFLRVLECENLRKLFSVVHLFQNCHSESILEFLWHSSIQTDPPMCVNIFIVRGGSVHTYTHCIGLAGYHSPPLKFPLDLPLI